MAFSNEESGVIPDCVTNYHLVDYKEELISFSTLPLQWSENEIADGLSNKVFLRGSTDNGLQQIYKKVTAWKFELSYVLPEIYVFSKDKTWIKLQKPRKSFENTIKTIMTTVHCLHFLKWNPEASKNALWNYLLKAFSSHEFEPSENDLLDHIQLINEAALRDKEIAKSEKLMCNSSIRHLKIQLLFPGFITIIWPLFYWIALRNGEFHMNRTIKQRRNLGLYLMQLMIMVMKIMVMTTTELKLLNCLMLFVHFVTTVVKFSDAGADTLCDSLGYTDAQVEAIPIFLCKNCEYQQHQCFVCGVLGSSNKSSSNNSSGAEVFSCVSATCGHFYHPKCVAKLLHPSNETQAEEVQNKIAAGESFTCPAHKCFKCKQGEDKKVYDLQFAMCRRCPKAYHRKCLPRDIVFESNDDKAIRAWDGLLPNRILIYCLDHVMIPMLGTPDRGHILFPGDVGKKKQYRLQLLVEKKRIEKGTISGSIPERTAAKMPKKFEKEYAGFTGGNPTKRLEEGLSRQGFEAKVTGASMKSLRVNNVSVQRTVCKPPRPDKTKSLFINDDSLPRMNSNAVKTNHQDFLRGKTQNTSAALPTMKKSSNMQPSVDAEMEKRMLALIQRSTSSFNMEEFIKKQKILSGGDVCSSRFAVDKLIPMGKVKGSVEAVRAALKKLEQGNAIEDAKDICEPAILKQIVKWQEKLRVYLAPFLHGMRYTSFGRHFTKIDKLKEIVNRLHWYVQDGDMMVDFCCGSNDFSCLLKEKLELMGKSCSFRNYDLFQAKNDLNFEKRDWMSVRTEELPAGSQLIMGLNPPFGVNASRANQFIAQALKFKPKLLILIVPRETKRLDKSQPPYDLIWEDDQLLSGKSFYLPGSLNVHDQQLEQWNKEAPPLYLWSRSDWTVKHKEIAQQHGHLPKELEERRAEGKRFKTVVSNYLMEENHDCYGDFSNIMNGCGDISRILDDIPEDPDYIEHEGAMSNVPCKQQESPSPFVEGCGGLQYGVVSHKMLGGGKHDMFHSETPRQSDEMHQDMELSSPTNSPRNNIAGPQSSSYRIPNAAFETHAVVNTARQPSLPGHLGFGTDPNAMFHPTVRNATGTGYMGGGYIQMHEGAFFRGGYNWSTGTSLNDGSLEGEDERPDYM